MDESLIPIEAIKIPFVVYDLYLLKSEQSLVYRSKHVNWNIVIKLKS